MIRLFLLVVVATLLWLLIVEAKRYMARDRKLEEYKDTIVDGELADIELDIATEKVRQKDVYNKVKDIKSKIYGENNHD